MCQWSCGLVSFLILKFQVRITNFCHLSSDYVAQPVSHGTSVTTIATTARMSAACFQDVHCKTTGGAVNISFNLYWNWKTFLENLQNSIKTFTENLNFFDLLMWHLCSAYVLESPFYELFGLIFCSFETPLCVISPPYQTSITNKICWHTSRINRSFVSLMMTSGSPLFSCEHDHYLVWCALWLFLPYQLLALIENIVNCYLTNELAAWGFWCRWKIHQIFSIEKLFTSADTKCDRVVPTFFANIMS